METWEVSIIKLGYPGDAGPITVGFSNSQDMLAAVLEAVTVLCKRDHAHREHAWVLDIEVKHWPSGWDKRDREEGTP